MAEWFECVCQYLRAQSANLSTVMQGLANQNTISDLEIGNDSISEHLSNPGNSGGLVNQIQPIQVFMVVLAIAWTYMFMFANENQETVKPANPNKGLENNDAGGPGDDDGPGAGVA